MVTRSDRLDHVHSDIRGPLYQEALRMESEGINVLKLNTGNPGRFGFKLPNSVRQALALHIDEAVPYCDVRGMAAARNVICTYHIGRGLQGIMPNDVFICNGVSEAASMLLNALIGTGDEILLPSPCYSLWSNNAYLCGGKPVFYRCDPANEWNPDIEDIESKITDRTKAILVINPNNPTGAVYSKEVLLAIAEIARQHHLVILADEIYDRLVMDGLRRIHRRARARPALRDVQRPFQEPHHLRLPLRLGDAQRPQGLARPGQKRPGAAGLPAPVRQRADPAGHPRRPQRYREHPRHAGARRQAL